MDDMTRGTNGDWSDPLDRSGRFSLYGQIVEQLHEAIDNGKLTDRMPTMETIAKDFGVNRNTAGRALRELRKDGIIVLSDGHGYFVIPPPHEGDAP
jgi:DNA-binding GntR family transcriptional regulator